jgi:uncharacterized membrane protein HdeD (DUF308 family)
MSTATADTMRAERSVARPSQYWWLFLVSGLAWLLFSVILFRFDYLTVSAISILFAVAVFAGAVLEFSRVSTVSGVGWKIAHALLGLVYVVAGVVSIIHPGDTFVALAAVMSIVLVILGAFDITSAFLTRSVASGWWLQLVVGVGEILLGFWAAGSWNISATLLVAWVAAFAIFRGITDIAAALRLHELRGLESR